MGYQCGMMARAWLDQRYPDAEAGSIEVAAYGVFTTNTNSEILQLLEDAENGSGCLRGTITGNEDTVASSWQCMYELMFNPDVEIPLNVWEDLNALNCVGFTAQNN